MIPKTIHYCWFGRGEKPRLAQKCIASWKKYCPDYEIKEWNEDNFDVRMNGYTEYCYNNKKWAFLSDYVRLILIEKYGGIYFDTDVEVIKPFDDLLANDAFYGFENNANVATGLGFGAVAGHVTVRSMISQYDSLLDGQHGVKVCPELNTNGLRPFGLVLNGKEQMLNGACVLPVEYLNPYDDPTGKMTKTSNTHSIHWYGKSWMTPRAIIRSKLTKPFHRLFGNNCFDWLKKK